MNAPLLNEIVNAVLYEGYILYPYRASSKKNRRERFTFGRVYPEAYSAAQAGAEPFAMQTECLVKTAPGPATLHVKIGFLHPLSREVCELETPATFPNGTQPDLKIASELPNRDQLLQSWHEAVEREVEPPTLTLQSGSPATVQFPFRFFGSRDLESIRDAQECMVGLIVRRQETVLGAVEINAQPLQSDLWKVTTRVVNHTHVAQTDLNDPEAILLRTFASTHTILSVDGGEFISLMDAPPEFKAAAAACRNVGAWPVLVGDEEKEERDTMLSAPIILYDYPKIAPESAGPLFDGTEIDEILTLRILTMTDEEKLEMRNVDAHARRLLERTENLPENALLKMHGTMHNTGDSAKSEHPPLRDSSSLASNTAPTTASAPIEFDDFFGASTRLQGVSVGGVYLQPGDRVRIRPKARADIFDLALNGQIAFIEAVEQDLEKRIHLAVVLENDPGKDLGLMRQPGHRFFYGVDEVEPLMEEAR